MKNLKTELSATTGQLQLAREQLDSQKHQFQETSRQLELTIQQHQETSSGLRQQLVQAVHQEKERGRKALEELQERYGGREGKGFCSDDEVDIHTFYICNTLRYELHINKVPNRYLLYGRTVQYGYITK
jgi:flagellar biosynthesis chaperone FliJ